MFEIIREHQMNIMLALCAICIMIAGLLLFTRFLSKRRKWILFLMELIAACLLAFDRAAYICRGDETPLGGFMVRLSNFMVFFLTSAVVPAFNLYLTDLLQNEAGLKEIPKRLKAVNLLAALGMMLVILSNFTGLFYYIDEHSVYHRGPGFLLSYAVPVLLPIVQYTVIRQYKAAFSRLIYTSLVLYIFFPITVGIIQIFTYGLSIVNMAIVLVSISLYIFCYLDINDAAERSHAAEVGSLRNERQSMKRLFDQTVTAFAAAAEKRDAYSEGHSVRVALLAQKLAEHGGKSAEECSNVYYAALLHDIGRIAFPDSLIGKTEGFRDTEEEQLRQKPVLSAEMLSGITEAPYLSAGVRACREWYDGSGYPDGLSGKSIPEIARIIAVADAYDAMISGDRTHAPLSYQVVREEFVKQSGTQFDPVYAEIMVQLMDSEHAELEQADNTRLESEIICNHYRETVSAGIPAEQAVTKITFSAEPADPGKNGFSAPSVIVFDSYDRHVHSDPKTIRAYRYTEFCELWFDGHYVSTNTRHLAVQVTENKQPAPGYEIITGRYDDHISVRMISPERTAEFILAVPDVSKSSYIGVTGEHCRICGLSAQKTGAQTDAGSIRRIISSIRYTDRLESDLPNVQIDHPRSAASAGIPLRDEIIVDFHTMSLPSADLVWHCPYLVIYSAEDSQVGGKRYREYALIKLNGEKSGSNDHAENTLTVKKNADFPGWEAWKRLHRKGLECSVRIVKKGGRIYVSTETLGIAIEHTTVILDGNDTIFAALTGDQVALTDIRVR